MHGPAVLSWLLALLTAATGGICLARLRRPSGAGHGHGDRHGGTHAPGRESDLAEAAMGLGTATMIVAGDRLPPPLWVGLFGLLGAGFLCAAAGRRAGGLRAHRLHHAVGALAMGYMALAMSGDGGHGRHPGMSMPMGLPAVTGLLLLYFGCYALWTGSRLLTVTVSGQPAPSPAADHPVTAPTAAVAVALPRACRLAMGVGMFAMLLVL